MADFETLYRLDQACFEEGVAYTREELRQFLALATAQAIVAEIDGAVAGFGVGYVSVRQLGHVVTLDVAAERRREGVGRALLEELLRRFAAASVRAVRLEVDVENASAIAFYEHFGFRRLRRLADYYGPNRPAWEMGLALRNA